VVLVAMVGGLRLLAAAEPAALAQAMVPATASVRTPVRTVGPTATAPAPTSRLDTVLAYSVSALTCEAEGCGFERRATILATPNQGWDRLLGGASATLRWSTQIAAPLDGPLGDLWVEAGDCGIHCTEPVHSRSALAVRF